MKAFFNSISPLMWLLIVLFSALFVLFPQIDIYFSELFYSDELGFIYSNHWLENVLYVSVRYLLIVMNISALILWLYNRFSKKNILDFNGKKLLFILLVLAIGSGLIVNALLKENWGRARPAQTTTFGGNLSFTPAFVLSDQGGYSFSSGHASAAFALIAFAMLANRHKKFWMILAISYGFAVGLARIVAGGHFLSDVIVSFFIIFITSKMLYYLMFKWKN